MKNLWNLIKKGIIFVLVIFLLSPAVLAQGERKLYRHYYVTGSVLDEDGAAVSGARVVAVFEDMAGIKSEAKTNEHGEFALRFLRKGNWIVCALTSGMMSEFKDVVLDSNLSGVVLTLAKTEVECITEAKTAIYNERLDEAIRILSWFIECYPESHELGSALFWISYTYERLSRGLKNRGEAAGLKQNALSHLVRLITDLPESNWRDAAEILQITLALQLYQMGRRRFIDVIENGLLIQDQERFDTKLAAIDALMSIDQQRAFPLVSDIALNNPDPDNRKKAVLILGQSSTKEALALLKQIAKQDPESSVRNAAAIWLER